MLLYLRELNLDLTILFFYLILVFFDLKRVYPNMWIVKTLTIFTFIDYFDLILQLPLLGTLCFEVLHKILRQ